MQAMGVFNLKGGVGKTATVVNLGLLAARAGQRTLIWDLDPQGAASFYLRVKPKVKGGGKGLVRGKTDLDDLVKATDYDNLDMVPADFSYRELDVRLADQKQSRLKKMLTPLKGDYDLVIFDCPPSISQLSEQIFRASDLLFVPLIPTTLSLRAFDQVQEFLKEEKITGMKIASFFSMVDRRKVMHREALEAKTKKRDGRLQTFIGYSSYVERMGVERRPVVDFAPRSAPAAGYRALWAEVAQRL
jgi:cellulose biosynthesis protein BcsQ